MKIPFNVKYQKLLNYNKRKDEGTETRNSERVTNSNIDNRVPYPGIPQFPERGIDFYLAEITIGK